MNQILSLAYSPNQQLQQTSRPLNDREAHGVHVKLEEDSRNAPVVLENAGVMCDTVLMRLQWPRPWRDVRCGHNMQEILVGYEGCVGQWVFVRLSPAQQLPSLTLMCQLERVIKRLCHVREIRPK